MKAGDSVSTAVSDDSRARLDIAFRDLGFAVKSLQLYPPSSPVVQGAVERAYDSLAPLVQAGYLYLEVHPRFFRAGDHEIGVGTPIAEQLARRMHGRGIAKLHLDRRLEAASLQRLAEVVALERKLIDEQGGFDALIETSPLTGIAVEMLELDRLFDDEAVDREEEDIWDAIVKGYQIDVEDDETPDIDWIALTRSVDRLQDFVKWFAQNLDSVAERTGYEQVDVMRFVLDKISTISETLTSAHANLLALAVRQAFDDFDPTTLVDLLAHPINSTEDSDESAPIAELEFADLPAGENTVAADGRQRIDIGTYIAEGLEPAQAEHLILHTLQTRQESTPRLYGLFSRLTANRSEREEMSEHVQEFLDDELARGDGSSDFLANWPRLFEVLNGEAPQRFLSSEYDASLQRLLVPTPLENAWPVEVIRPRLSEMSPSFVSLRKSLMVARLLDEEMDDADYRRLALELETSLQRLLEDDQFRTLRKLVRELIEVSDDTERPRARRQLTTGIVERFYTADTVRYLIRASLDRADDEIQVILDIIRARGQQAIPPLLDVMSVEENRRVRQRLLRLLPEMGTGVSDLVAERFDDDRWFVLRNLAIILGEMGDADAVEKLEPLYRHADERVRHEAIASTIRLGGEHALPLLLQALDPADQGGYLMALHGLGYHGDESAKQRIRKLLRLPNLRGQNSQLIRVAAIALGRLEDADSRASLSRLATKPWLFARRREPVRNAALWALGAVSGERRGNPPDPGFLAELCPGAGFRRLRVRS